MPDASGAGESEGKGSVPKGFSAEDCILGHMVNNHMTVIKGDGALSEAERVVKISYYMDPLEADDTYASSFRLISGGNEYGNF